MQQKNVIQHVLIVINQDIVHVIAPNHQEKQNHQKEDMAFMKFKNKWRKKKQIMIT